MSKTKNDCAAFKFKKFATKFVELCGLFKKLMIFVFDIQTVLILGPYFG